MRRGSDGTEALERTTGLRWAALRRRLRERESIDDEDTEATEGRAWPPQDLAPPPRGAPFVPEMPASGRTPVPFWAARPYLDPPSMPIPPVASTASMAPPRPRVKLAVAAWAIGISAALLLGACLGVMCVAIAL